MQSSDIETRVVRVTTASGLFAFGYLSSTANAFGHWGTLGNLIFSVALATLGLFLLNAGELERGFTGLLSRLVYPYAVNNLVLGLLLYATLALLSLPIVLALLLGQAAAWLVLWAIESRKNFRMLIFKTLCTVGAIIVTWACTHDPAIIAPVILGAGVLSSEIMDWFTPQEETQGTPQPAINRTAHAHG